MYLIFRLVLNALALLIVAHVIPGVYVQSFYYALLIALVLGIVNALLRPILIVATLPVNILTLGLFTLVINAFLFWFVSYFLAGFRVETVWAAFFGALVLWAISWLTNSVIKKS